MHYNNKQHPCQEEEQPPCPLFVFLWTQALVRRRWKQMSCVSWEFPGVNADDAHSSLHGDGDCLCPAWTGPRLHRSYHPSVERGAGTFRYAGAGVTSSLWSQRSRDGVEVSRDSAPVALRWTLGELLAGGAFRAKAVLASSRSIPERPTGSPGTRFDPDLIVPLRHRDYSGFYRSPLLDRSPSERCDCYGWTPGGHGRADESDSPRGVHPQPSKTRDGRSKSRDQ